MAEKPDDFPMAPFIVHLSKPLGKGTFGSVFLATHHKRKTKAALKKIQYAEANEANNTFIMKMAEKEIQNMMCCDGHPNIVRYFQHFDDGTSFWLAMEYCELGDLDHYLLNHNTNPDLQTKINLMLQCTRGIAFMHTFSPPFVHRDIKLKNYLVTHEDGKDVVKVTDFGVAKLILDSPLGKTAAAASNFMQTFAGTPSFMAPEFFDSEKTLQYGAYVDIFSLGLVLQTLLNFSEENKSTLPQIVGKALPGMPIGMLICNAEKSDWPIPQVVIVHDDDSDPIKRLKDVIKDMTHHIGKQRKELWLVEEELEDILSSYDDKTPHESENEDEDEVKAEESNEAEQPVENDEKTVTDNMMFSKVFDLSKFDLKASLRTSTLTPLAVPNEEKLKSPVKDDSTSTKDGWSKKRVSPLRDATLKPSKDEYTTDAFKMTVYPEGLTSLDDRKKSFEAAGGARSKVPSTPAGSRGKGSRDYRHGPKRSTIPKKSNIPESGDAGDALEYEDESCSRIIDQETLKKFTMTKYGGEVKSVEKRKMELDAAKKRASPEMEEKNQKSASEREKEMLEDYGKKSNQYEDSEKDELEREVRKAFDVTNIDDFTPLMKRMSLLYEKQGNG